MHACMQCCCSMPDSHAEALHAGVNHAGSACKPSDSMHAHYPTTAFLYPSPAQPIVVPGLLAGPEVEATAPPPSLHGSHSVPGSPFEALPDALQHHILRLLLRSVRREGSANARRTWDALLRTNRQLRACASAFIYRLTIEFRLSHAFDPSCDAASMAQGEAALARFGQQQLACFPRLAVLRSLHLVNACKSIFHGHAALMLTAHAAACSALQQLTTLALDNFVSAAAHQA